MNKWTKRFMERAALISTWSKDPSTQCGAIIVDDRNHVISEGYNGFPRGVADTQARYADRTVKLKMVLHAELNAILSVDDRSRLNGATIYVHPMPPCGQCAAAIVQVGIKRVITIKPTPEQIERWVDDFTAMENMFQEASVDLVYVTV